MREEYEKKLNDFFVDTFNSIMDMEERALSDSGKGDLSVKEMHVLSAVEQWSRTDKGTMSQVASSLGVTVGSLTTAVTTLVRKGYLTRGSDPSDKRLVLVRLTPEGKEACDAHAAFHRRMIGHVGEMISDEAEMETLTRSLDTLTTFFRKYAK